MGAIYIIKNIPEHAISLRESIKMILRREKKMRVLGFSESEKGKKAQYEKQERKCFQDFGKF